MFSRPVSPMLSITPAVNDCMLTSSVSNGSVRVFSRSDNSCIWSENPRRAFTAGCFWSSVSSVGFICAEMLWMNSVFSRLCSFAVAIASFCLRVSMMKRSNMTASNPSAPNSTAASTHNAIMMYCLPLMVLSLSAIVARLSSYLACSAAYSLLERRALTESVHTLYFSYVRPNSGALLALTAMLIRLR